jgi:hypothetical protein
VTHSFRLRSLLCFGLFSLGSLSAVHAAADSVNAIGDARISKDTSLRRSFEFPAGPKLFSFDAALEDSVNSLPHRDEFSYTIKDGKGLLLLSVVFKPTSQSVNPDLDPATWEVFYAIGTNALVSSKMTVAEKQLMTYSLILTSKGATFRFGPAGESYTFSSQPLIPTGTVTLASGDSKSRLGNGGSNPDGLGSSGPRGYGLDDRSLVVDFVWQTPEGAMPGANQFKLSGFSTNPAFLGSVIRGVQEPGIRYPDRPVVSPN